MSVLYTLSPPVNVGSLTSPITLLSLLVTAVSFSSRPVLAPMGTGVLTITLTDPANGWQETVTYNDTSVLDLWDAPVTSSPGASLQDVMAGALFAKLIADGKLPPGYLT